LRSGAKTGVCDEERRAPDAACRAARRGKKQGNFNAIIKRWQTPNMKITEMEVEKSEGAER
jgi:hypothetical protein